MPDGYLQYFWYNAQKVVCLYFRLHQELLQQYCN